MKCRPSDFKVAVIGAGIAGATCARALSAMGVSVHVVDKSRGAGGRLATRRLEWQDPQGQRRIARFDHGAPAFTASGADFRRFLVTAIPPETLTHWRPVLATGSRPLDGAAPLWLSQPDMPALCRALLRDIPTSWSFAVDRLLHGPLGWQVEASGTPLAGHFDAVVLALPPAQVAPLLAPHRRDWSQRASVALMQPCWTLMGVASQTVRELNWDVSRPENGPLAWVMRNDARPGREPSIGAAHWVAHARAGWSRQHLEQPTNWVQCQLQSAMQECLGEPIEWLHAVVHRWRYAVPHASGGANARPCWWDGARGLGVCGDFLGGTGVEGAWQSAQALIEVLSRHVSPMSTPPDASLTDHQGRRACA